MTAHAARGFPPAVHSTLRPAAKSFSTMYDPTDEFDQIEESSRPALGEGRRQTLDALDRKDSLPMIDPPDGDSDSAGFDSF